MSTSPKIESNDLTIESLYKDFYTVPAFQREYVWEAENVERLLLDIQDEFYDEQGRLMDSADEYFIGSIVVCCSVDGRYELIDGQQRLTTVYLVLCAIRDYLLDLNEKPPDALAVQIRSTSMDPVSGDDVWHFRLELLYEDSSDVLQRIADPEIPPAASGLETASVRNILTAYQTIRDFCAANFAGDAKKARQFLAALTHRVKLIRIVTPSLAHALKVFETINDRGVGLNAMDLLKNLLFMEASRDDYAKLNVRWKDIVDTLDGCREKPLRFLRYFIMSHFTIDWARPLREDEIYQWLVDHKDECGISSDPIGFANLLVDRASAWANLMEGRTQDGEKNPYLRNIALLSGAARQHYILLLAGLHLPSDLFTRLAHEIENLFFTYVITRESTKNFERNFARWSGALRSVQSPSELDAFLAENFRPDLASRRNALDFAFQELSAWRLQQYRLRYILAKLTQYIEEQAWGNPAHKDLGNYMNQSVDIEHILPQTPTAEVRAAFDNLDEYDGFAQRLGNLTLLEKTINTAVSNGSYADKKAGYKESSFLLTRSLVQKPQVGKNTMLNRAVEDLIQFEAWDSGAIERRQEMLGMLARRVWLPGIDEGEPA